MTRSRLLEPDADNTDEGRKTMKEQLSVVNGQSSASESAEMQKPAREQGLNTEPTSDETKLPASQKIYVSSPHVSKGSPVESKNFQLRVPFREIALTPSKAMDGTIEENPPVRVYDTSGPWTDPEQKHNVRVCP